MGGGVREIPEDGEGKIGYQASDLGIADTADPDGVFLATGPTHSTTQDSNCVATWSDGISADLGAYYDEAGPGGAGVGATASPGNSGAPNITNMCEGGASFTEQQTRLNLDRNTFPNVSPNGALPGWWGVWESSGDDNWKHPGRWGDRLTAICNSCENYGKCKTFDSRVLEAIAAASQTVTAPQTVTGPQTVTCTGPNCAPSPTRPFLPPPLFPTGDTAAHCAGFDCSQEQYDLDNTAECVGTTCTAPECCTVDVCPSAVISAYGLPDMNAHQNCIAISDNCAFTPADGQTPASCINSQQLAAELEVTAAQGVTGESCSTIQNSTYRMCLGKCLDPQQSDCDRGSLDQLLSNCTLDNGISATQSITDGCAAAAAGGGH